jgi:hypothetical protein
MSTFLQVNHIKINGIRYESVATSNDHILCLENVKDIQAFSVELRSGLQKCVLHSFGIIYNMQGLQKAVDYCSSARGDVFAAYLFMPPHGDLPKEWVSIIHENRRWFRQTVFLFLAPTPSAQVSMPFDGIVLTPLSEAIKPISIYFSFAYAIIAMLCALTCGGLAALSFYSKLSWTITYILIGCAFAGKVLYSRIFVNNKGFSPAANTIFFILVLASPFIEVALYQIVVWPNQNGDVLNPEIIYTMAYFFCLFIQTFFPLEKSQLSYRGKTMVFIWHDTKNHDFEKAVRARYGEDKVVVCTWWPVPGKASLHYFSYLLMAIFWRIVQGFSLNRTLNDHGSIFYASAKSFLKQTGPLKTYVWVVHYRKGDNYAINA